ncbi:hypothetical protein, partial [Treponema sp. R6D11]
IKGYIAKLEKHYLANKEKNLAFALLIDFKEASEKEIPQDKDILSAEAAGVDELNAKYGEIFYCFQRRRVHDDINKKYVAYERKRGAILELVNLIKNGDRGSFITPKNIAPLRDFKYIIALDIDTTLGIDVAKKMIGSMEHPLNSPVLCGGRVI